MVKVTANRVLCGAICMLVVSGGRWFYCWLQDAPSMLADMFAISSILIAFIMLDIYRLKPASSHTITTLLSQYLMAKILLIAGYLMQKRFEYMCNGCKAQQAGILREILAQNKDTLFAQDHGLENIDSVKEFRQNMPLTTFTDYRKYSEMIKENGTENVLFPGKAIFLALTSGTSSGKSKMFPKNPKSMSKASPWFVILQYIICYRAKNNLLKKWFFVKVSPKLLPTKSGIDSGPISAMSYRTGGSIPFFASPATSVSTEHDSFYIHIVFGLSEDDITYFSTMVSTSALSLLTILEQNWESICDDIESGRLSKELKIPEIERHRLNKLLNRNPKRAAFLRKQFRNGFENIISRVWPTCPCLIAIKTGVFEAPAKVLQEKYLGKMPCITVLHIGTETVYGMNLDPTSSKPDVNMVAFIPVNFFEFVPEEEIGKTNPMALLAHEVEVGKRYEMVITTFDGLCRYRTEDVVQITGFLGTTPVYKFVCRAGDILSADLEKVPEFLLHSAVFAAAAQCGKNIVDFTSCESIHVQRMTGSDTWSRHYVVFIELRDSQTLDETAMKLVDDELRQRHVVYSAMRTNDKLQPIQFIQMKSGAFQIVKQKILASNPDVFCTQYKLPRIVRRENILKNMLEMRI